MALAQHREIGARSQFEPPRRTRPARARGRCALRMTQPAGPRAHAHVTLARNVAFDHAHGRSSGVRAVGFERDGETVAEPEQLARSNVVGQPHHRRN